MCILQFCEDAFDLRSLESYLEQCEELDTGPYDQYSKEYGLNIRSAFTQLKYFDLCNGSLLTDITVCMMCSKACSNTKSFGLDLVAFVQQRGLPDYFVTLTAFDGWPHVQTTLARGWGAIPNESEYQD